MEKDCLINTKKIKKDYFRDTSTVINMNSTIECKTIPINKTMTSKGIIVYADLCGIKKEDILIELIGNTLKISAERNKMAEGLGSEEIKTGSLIRLIQLENIVSKEGIKAKYEDGLLTIILPRKREDEVFIKVE